MSKHTPGPWRIEGRLVMAKKAKAVCELPCGGVMHGKVDKANAVLVAAAPDLLDALKAALLLTNPYGSGFHLWEQAARSAVAKAEGRPDGR